VRGVCATDVLDSRLAMSKRMGADHAWNGTATDIAAEMRLLTAGRGADVVIVAASAPGIVGQAIAASRPGARIMLFAQTSPEEVLELRGADLCAADRSLLGSYSASVDLQEESVQTVWRDDFPVEDLISHRLPLDELEKGIELARKPAAGSLKLVVYPQR
jgi:L-iditol 2-dehydrogenase